VNDWTAGDGAGRRESRDESAMMSPPLRLASVPRAEERERDAGNARCLCLLPIAHCLQAQCTSLSLSRWQSPICQDHSPSLLPLPIHTACGS
jgi:hypothetical protein